MRIDFLIGDNPYGSTRYFSKSFAAALEKKGAACRLFDISGENFYKAFYAISSDPPDLTCSFSDVTVGGEPLGDAWGIPHLSFLIDPAVYFLHQLQGNYSMASTVDRGDFEFLQTLGFERTFFLPHGVDASLEPGSGPRPYDVVLVGSVSDYEALPLLWRQRYSTAVAEQLLSVCERVLSPEGVSILRALQEANLSLDYHFEIDGYVTSKDRVELVRATHAHVFGRGPWEKYCPEAHIHGPIPFGETLEVLRQSKIVLNSAPRFKNGSHERLLMGPLLGALVCTGETPYVKDNFRAGESILTYPFGQWEEAVEAIERSLGHSQEMAEEAARIVRSHHTWDQRAGQLILALS